MDSSWWIAFNVGVLVMLAIDLGLFHRKAHVVSVREALIWTAVWISMALAFNVLVWNQMGEVAALQFLTGYVIEKALSVDNVFVFAVIFSYFAVPREYQHRVLFFGVLGALIMRAIMIFAGIALIDRFEWIIYVFGVFLIYSGYKFAFAHGALIDPSQNPILKLVKRYLPVSDYYEGQRFFVRRAGRLVATPLLVVLVMVEVTDVIFAVDSIPAILAITRDPFIVYTSNVFAILGLRSLYFALAGVMNLFTYLHYGLAAILVFVGVKMLLPFKVKPEISLAVIALILGVAVVASLIRARRDAEAAARVEAALEHHDGEAQ